MINLDIIGLLYSDDGETPLPDWHVNTTPETIVARPELASFIVEPDRMRRVWMGDDPLNPSITVALRFIDEDAASTALA